MVGKSLDMKHGGEQEWMIVVDVDHVVEVAAEGIGMAETIAIR